MKRTVETASVAFSVLFILQPLSAHLQNYINWDVVNPASNHLGWYWASLQNWMLSWVWPSTWLVMWSMKGDMMRAWLLLLTLSMLNICLPEISLWELGVFTEEERWLIGLCSWYLEIGKYSSAAALAVTSIKCPALLVPSLLLSSLWIFWY